MIGNKYQCTSIKHNYGTPEGHARDTNSLNPWKKKKKRKEKSLTSRSFDFPLKISTINKKWGNAEQNLDQIESILQSCSRDNKYYILEIWRYSE